MAIERPQSLFGRKPLLREQADMLLILDDVLRAEFILGIPEKPVLIRLKRRVLPRAKRFLLRAKQRLNEMGV